MKAIKIRVIPATNTKDVRLKASAVGGISFIEARSNEIGIEEQAMEMAKKYLVKANWYFAEISGWGWIAERDLVVTIKNKNEIN
jgi:hypothetical protein